MSYILDALRRADAERERGHVPGLHSQPVPPASADAPPARTLAPLVAAGIGAAVLLLGAAGWWVLGRDVPAPPVAARVPAPAPAPVVAAAPSPAPAPAPVPPAPLAAPPALPAAPPPPVLARPAPPPEAPPPRPAPAPAPAAPDSRVVGYEQLPDDVRRQLPPLAIGGAIYSDSPASRLLIVGGQLLHEGDSAAAGVVLEQIKPRSAVLRWRDLRYEVSF